MRTVVVVGAGLAGLSAAVELRRLGWAGRLVIVGDEIHRPYRRPPLSKDFLLAQPSPALQLAQADEVGAEWRLGLEATGLDLQRRAVGVSDGDEISFDGLVIATGAAARQAPAHLTHPEVVHLRSLDDAVALRERLAVSRRVLVIGAGFLGTEIAAAAVQLGKEVTLLDRVSQPLLAAVGEDVGRRVAELHRGQGVHLLLDARVGRLDRDGSTLHARLDDGTTLSADLVVAALGSRPSTRWLSGSGLRLDDGVVLGVDGLAAPGVTAAGDVARWPHPLLNHEQVRVEHYSNAVDQGRHAARALLGHPLNQPAPLPSFWSHQYDWHLQSVGFTGARYHFTMVDRDDAGRFTGEYHHHGRLVGAITNRRRRDLVGYRARLLDQASVAY